ncbi:MAG: GAF domain-containing SpoIIE family protein phosphatase, partial [Planctomycetota bacterium]
MAQGALHSMDAANDGRFDASQSIADFRIRSLICAPLLNSEGVPFGALQIDTTSNQGQFAAEDVDLLSSVATQAATVIRNAQLHEQALQQREVEQDLKLATEVQQAFLPQAPLEIPGWRVLSYYQAANHIGGDYFDYVTLPDGRIAVIVADVVGHGVAAAMFMAKLSAETRFCLAGSPDDLAAAIMRLNDRLSQLLVERFVTFLMMVISPDGDTVSIVNAGHMPPICRSSDKEEIHEPGEEESGLPIAIDEGMDYEVVRIDMAYGDLAVMYTDGINEAMNADGDEFGMEAVREITQRGTNSQGVMADLTGRVKAFIGDGIQHDDMCVVILQRVENKVDNGDANLSQPAATVRT